MTGRAVCSRIALQMGIALLLLAATLPLPQITGHLLDSAASPLSSTRVGAGIRVLGGLLLFAFGGLAAALSRLVARKPWDGLGAAATFAVILWSSARSFEAAVPGLLPLAGCALVAWLVRRRPVARTAPA